MGYDKAFLYDVFNPAARAYAWDAVDAGYIKPYGLHHFWLDCDEPCGGDMSNLLYRNGTWPASFVGAAYPHFVDKMNWEGMVGGRYADDIVMLGRSAWAGSQRFGGAVWSGDTTSNFQNLNEQFRAGLNLVMSGIPYWTSDIGGYNGGDIDSPSFRQLIVRWFQWGAFCPIFRSHGRRLGGPDEDGGRAECGDSRGSNEIWNFGAEAERAIAKVMAIREQLRPYIMTLYKAASERGEPIMRPLFYDFWQDSESQLIDDQMMFGPDYLVAPHLVENATSRDVYLPPLEFPYVWQNFFSHEVYNTTAGGSKIHIQTPIDSFGLFYRLHKPLLPPSPPPPPLDLSRFKTQHGHTLHVSTFGSDQNSA